jgi:hypothetical protein
MNRIGLSHIRNDAMSRLHVASLATPAPHEALQAGSEAIPSGTETIYEIGVILALHLAFAFAILLTLQAFGVS